MKAAKALAVLTGFQRLTPAASASALGGAVAYWEAKKREHDAEVYATNVDRDAGRLQTSLLCVPASWGRV